MSAEKMQRLRNAYARDVSLPVERRVRRAVHGMERLVIRALDPQQDSLVSLKKLLRRSHVSQADCGMGYFVAGGAFQQELHGFTRGDCLVAIHNARVIAAIAIGPPDRESRCQHYRHAGIAVLLAHAVETDWDGRDANRAILTFACRLLGAQGYRQLAVDVPASASELIDMYRRCGFKYVDAVDREAEAPERIVLSRPIMTGEWLPSTLIMYVSSE